MRRGLVVALALSVFCPVAVAQQTADATVPQFDVVSIKPCDPGAGAGGPRGGGRPSPDRLYVPCMPVRGLIGLAFLRGQSPRVDNPVVGGPDWINSARYAIEAVAPGIPLNAAMRNSMLARILTERFNLRVRRDPRSISAYALTVARDGARLETLRDGDCVQEQTPQPPRPRISPEGTRPPVDPALLNADPPRAASIFTALQEQLGLRLEPSKATVEVVVIESIDRPAPN